MLKSKGGVVTPAKSLITCCITGGNVTPSRRVTRPQAEAITKGFFNTETSRTPSFTLPPR